MGFKFCFILVRIYICTLARIQMYVYFVFGLHFFAVKSYEGHFEERDHLPLSVLRCGGKEKRDFSRIFLDSCASQDDVLSI